MGKVRMNWRQACVYLGCSKTTFYKMVSNGRLVMHGVGTRYRWVWKDDLDAVLLDEDEKGLEQKPQPARVSEIN